MPPGVEMSTGRIKTAASGKEDEFNGGRVCRFAGHKYPSKACLL